MLTPKQSEFSMPAEWYPHAGCWMGWPCHQATWKAIGLERAYHAYARVAQAIARFEPVTMLVNPGDERIARHYCGDTIRQVSLPMNDSWLRDTGPTFLLNAKQQLAGVDWIHNAWGHRYEPYDLDNTIAQAVLEMTRAQIFQAPLVMEGGSFHVDGEGTLITTEECLLNTNRNPLLSKKEISHYLYEYLNIEKIIWLSQGLWGDETNGHVDEIACFIAPGQVLCLITKDRSDVNYARLNDNFQRLKSSRDAKGRLLEVIAIEQPPPVFLHQTRLTLSYINFYMANGGIVMPAFGQKAYDEAAFEIVGQCFPQRQIIQIDALDIFAGGGGIHCITQQQPTSV